MEEILSKKSSKLLFFDPNLYRPLNLNHLLQTYPREAFFFCWHFEKEIDKKERGELLEKIGTILSKGERYYRHKIFERGNPLDFADKFPKLIQDYILLNYKKGDDSYFELLSDVIGRNAKTGLFGFKLGIFDTENECLSTFMEGEGWEELVDFFIKKHGDFICTNDYHNSDGYECPFMGKIEPKNLDKIIYAYKKNVAALEK